MEPRKKPGRGKEHARNWGFAPARLETGKAARWLTLHPKESESVG